VTGDYPVRNSRGASSPFHFPFSVFYDPIHPGIPPKAAKQPTTLAITGFSANLPGKMAIYSFGFSRNYA
ncbi:hypothetical protein ACNAHS_004616, partial [Escherichia coli]